MAESFKADMARSEQGTEESVQDQIDSDRSVDDDCTDGWSHRVLKSTRR
jgi:hypothetical protein